MRDLLGGKGANVAEMTRVLGARAGAGRLHDHHRGLRGVHGGRAHRARGPRGAGGRGAGAAGGAGRQAPGRRRGPAAGVGALGRARVDARHARHRPEPGPERRRRSRAWPRATGNERFAWDSYRRFVQMFGNVCRGVRGEAIEDAIKQRKQAAGVKLDTELSVDDLKGARRRLQGPLPRPDRRGLPAGPARAADPGDPGGVRLLGRRAGGEYRRINAHPGRLGHGGERAADGVRQQGRPRRARAWPSARDEVTGAPEPSGDFLVNAQGEDVVSGVRTPLDIAELARRACPTPTPS